MSVEAERAQAEMIAALQRRLAAQGTVRLIETHISWVLLFGRRAYKIKKAVDLGFLDFSTLEKRRRYCEEELRLNRRLAPHLYRAVVALTGTRDAPQIGRDGAPLDYAVEMRRFAQSALLSSRLSRDRLPPEVIDALAERVAEFHAQAAPCSPDADFGALPAVRAPIAENFRQLRRLLPGEDAAQRLRTLETWSIDRSTERVGVIAVRKQAGRVRECHGDLHLGNVALVGGKPLVFDCIEFNPGLRWIDVINEVAFMVMDLEERGRPDYAYRFLDRWLQLSGDYAGLPLMPFYQVYRALVRAKVAAIRADQEKGAARDRELAECERYLDYALATTRPRRRFVALMYGVSGAGKSWVAQTLLESAGAVRVRSDVERKRLAGVSSPDPNRGTIGGGLYGDEMTAATYARLAELAAQVLSAGYPVVVDAASLKAWQRAMFSRLADETAVPFRLVVCHASLETLQQRLLDRAEAGVDVSDADVSVLAQQMRAQEPLSEAEQRASLRMDTDDCDKATLLRRLAGFIAP